MALIIGIVIGPKCIQLLSAHRIKQVFRTRQQVRELATLHESKAGIPTLGGIIIAIASLTSATLFVSFNDFVVLALGVYVLCSLVGLLDDLLKIVRDNSNGISSWQKLTGQCLISVLFLAIIFCSPQLKNNRLSVSWPWFNQTFSGGLGIFILISFYMLVLTGTSNAVNLTDGIDGLAISNLFFCFLFLSAMAFLSYDFSFATHSALTYSSSAKELAVLCACFAGGCFAFCAFNLHPASVFMGDMGSIGLGGLLAATAILLKIPLILPFVGIIFVMDTLSVILQISTLRLFKRRIFLMSPVHHHFELKGYSERTIVKSAFIIQIIGVIIAYSIIKYGHF